MIKTNNKLSKVWKYKRLGDMFNFVGGGTPSKTQPDFWNGDLNWASVKDVKGNYLNSTKDFITENGLKNSASNLAEKGDVILITRISPGKSIITNIRTAINQDLKIAKPKFKTTSKFIYYFFSAIERYCIKKSSGTTVLGITLNNLNELLIPDLSIEEQTLIVSKIEELFSELDKGIEDLKTAQQQLKTYRQSVLKYAFEGKLTNKKVKEGVLPKGWKVVISSEIMDIRDGTHDTPKYVQENGIPLITSKNLKGNSIDFKKVSFISKEDHSEISKRSKVEEGDVLFAMIGTIGNPAIIKGDTNFSIKNVGLFKNNETVILSEFFVNFLRSSFFEKQLNERKLLKGTTQRFIPLGNLRKIEIPLPPLQEQHQIVQEIESRLRVADKMEESIGQSLLQAEALRQSILKKAFSGELV